MSTCKDCLHIDVCEALENGNGVKKVHPIQCGCFKPKADYALVKHGKWVKDRNKRTCSICGFLYLENGKTTFNFCPNCGAKMKGGIDNGR